MYFWCDENSFTEMFQLPDPLCSQVGMNVDIYVNERPSNHYSNKNKGLRDKNNRNCNVVNFLKC